MEISARSLLMSGVSAVTASALAIAPVAVPPPGALTSTEVRLSAAVAPQPFLAAQPVITDTAALQALAQLAPSLGITPPTPPGPAPAPQGQGLANAIVNAWYAVEPWISYGVDLADWALGWIPFGYLLGDQISLFWYNLVLPVTDAVIVDKIAPIVANPLNLNVWWNGFVDVASATVNGLINLGVAELYYWFGWILPPCPPGFCGLAATTATTAALTAEADAPTLQSLLGDLVLPPVDAATDALVGANQQFFKTVQDVTEFGLFDVATPLLDRLHLDFASEQIDLNYTLLNRLATEQVGFTDDVITVPGRFLHDAFETGHPLQAAVDQVEFLSDSAATRTDNAIAAIVDYGQAQLGHVIPGGTAAEPATESLRTTGVTDPDPTETGTTATGTGPRSATQGIVRGQGPLAGPLSKLGSRIRESATGGDDVGKAPATTGVAVKPGAGAKKAIDDLKKTVADVRKTVRDASTGGGKKADKADDE